MGRTGSTEDGVENSPLTFHWTPYRLAGSRQQICASIDHMEGEREFQLHRSCGTKHQEGQEEQEPERKTEHECLLVARIPLRYTLNDASTYVFLKRSSTEMVIHVVSSLQ